MQRITGIFEHPDRAKIPSTASFSISIRLRASSEPYNETPLTLPPGRERLATKPVRRRISGRHNDGNGGGLPVSPASAGGVPTTTMTSGFKPHEFRR